MVNVPMNKGGYLVNEKIRLRDPKEKHSLRFAQGGSDNGEKGTHWVRSGNQHETLRRRFVVRYTNATTSDVLLPNTREYRCGSMHPDEPYRHAAPAAVTDSFPRFFTYATRPADTWAPLRTATVLSKRENVRNYIAPMGTKDAVRDRTHDRSNERVFWRQLNINTVCACEKTHVPHVRTGHTSRPLKLMYFWCRKIDNNLFPFAKIKKKIARRDEK